MDGPTTFTAGTLFPKSSKKTARAINAASGNRPLVVLANLSGFDGSPESLRELQLEYGAEIGRAVVNFDGPIVFCVVSRYHGGAFVVFSATLNESMEIAAVEGSYASVIGGAPAAAVVFAGEVNKRTAADRRISELEARIAEARDAGAESEAAASHGRARRPASRRAIGEARPGRRRVRHRAQRAAGAPDRLGAHDHPHPAAALPGRRRAARYGPAQPSAVRTTVAGNARRRGTESDQRVAIVTGGARGIGAAITTALARSGVHVAAGYTANSKAAEELAGKLNAEGASVSVHQGNVGEPEDCQRVVQEVLDAKGRVDHLVNNAGITVDKTMRRMTIDDWHAVLRINLSGAFYMTKAVLDHMLEREYGRIVNISSVIGQMGNIGQVNYAASKAGLFGFTQSLARETAFKGITVNCVAPGYIETEMVAAVPEAAMEKILAKIPVGRLGEAHEIARAVQFLCRRRRRLHHRVGDLGQRRHGHVGPPGPWVRSSARARLRTHDSDDVSRTTSARCSACDTAMPAADRRPAPGLHRRADRPTTGADRGGAVQTSWQVEFATPPVRVNGRRYQTTFSLPMGDDPEMIADKRDVLARNLVRAPWRSGPAPPTAPATSTYWSPTRVRPRDRPRPIRCCTTAPRTCSPEYRWAYRCAAT